MKTFNGTPKVYLAGPDVFLPDAKEKLAGLQKICKAHGLRGLSPFDGGSSGPKDIFDANAKMILEANYVVANISPWRGPSCDVGTAVEIGFAYALGKPIFAYTCDPNSYVQKCRDKRYGVSADYITHYSGTAPELGGKYMDKYGFLIEQFEGEPLQDNLMVACAIQPEIANSFRHAIDNLMEYIS